MFSNLFNFMETENSLRSIKLLQIIHFVLSILMMYSGILQIFNHTWGNSESFM